MAAREEDYLAVEVKVKYNRHKHFLFHYGHPMYDYRSKYSKYMLLFYILFKLLEKSSQGGK